MKKRKKKHSVSCLLEVHQLTKAGTSIQFEIRAHGDLLGRIVIGQGSFSWLGKGRHREKEWDWTRFAALMDREAYGTD